MSSFILGFSSGYRLVEKITREHPKFKDELELMKFVCKDYWMCIFRKQIDNLRTNHQGVYVLQDKSFKYLQPISASKQYFEDSSVFLVFTCGLLRGSLANLGIKSVVTTEVVSLPGKCNFSILEKKSCFFACPQISPDIVDPRQKLKKTSNFLEANLEYF